MIDILIGIPSFNEAKTIAQVVKTVDEGLVAAFPGHSAIIVNADSDSVDGTKDVFLSIKTYHPKVYINSGSNPRGKGVNILSLLQFAYQNDIQAVCFFDADVVSLETYWINQLLHPVIKGEADLVTPLYRRNRFEANTTNHLIYPYLFAVFGKHMRQPIAGDFALSGNLCRYILSLTPGDLTLLYGIDAFISTYALIKKFRVQQVSLSRKIHKQSFPNIAFISRCELDALFRAFLATEKRIEMHCEAEAQTMVSIDDRAILPDNLFIERSKLETQLYIKEHSDEIKDLFKNIPISLLKSKDIIENIDMSLWLYILARGYELLDVTNISFVRDHIVALFICRVFTYWNEIANQSNEEIEHTLNQQALLLRSLLLQKTYRLR